jgi:ATP-dependent helicase IRC3
MQLRNYQGHCIDAVCSFLLMEDKQRGLVVLPTAAGKTVVFSELPKYFSGQTLVVAHRRELIKQAAKKLRAANPTLRVEIEMADDRAHHEADVIVASVQTIISQKRRERLKKSDFGLIIVDEAHHCAEGNGYHTVLKDLGAFNQGGPKLLGVTATPYRTGGESLATFFEGVAYEKPLLEMIEEGWVSPLSAYAVRTHTSLDKVGTRGGDFKENELSDAVDNETRNLEIVRAWQHVGKKRRSTLVFAVDVEHAQHLVATFKAADVKAELVLGTTPDAERESIFPRFVAGEFPVLVNVGVATEGTDLPPVDCILLARPTKSSLLITQMCGRGLRLWCPHGCAERKCTHPDSKQDCVIVDMVDNTTRHKLATSATVLGLPGNVNAKGRDMREVRKAFNDFVREFPNVDLETPKEISIDWFANKRREIRELMARSQTTVSTTIIDLLGKPSAAVKKISNLSWIRSHDGNLKLRIPPASMKGGNDWVEVSKDASDHWWVHMPNEAIAKGPFPQQDKALYSADAYVREHFQDRMRLLDGSARWLRDPATPAQCELIRRLGGQVPERLTKGDAKRTIDFLKLRKDERADGPCTPRQAFALRRLGLDPERVSFKRASEIISQRSKATSA